MKLKDCFEEVYMEEIEEYFLKNKGIDENDYMKRFLFRAGYAQTMEVIVLEINSNYVQKDRDRKIKIYKSDSSKGNSNDSIEVELVNFQGNTGWKDWLKADVECELSLSPGKIAEIALREKLARVNNWDI